MFRSPFILIALLIPIFSFAQIKWQNVDSLYGPLPTSVHVFYTDQQIDTGSFRAFYVIADLKDKKLDFTADTTHKRRFTPTQFYQKNGHPLIVVNCTFFSFETNQNLNIVIKEGQLVSYNIHSVGGRGRDTLTYRHPFGSAIGISKKRTADIAWLYTDSFYKHPFAKQYSIPVVKDSISYLNFASVWPTAISGRPNLDYGKIRLKDLRHSFTEWKMNTSVGGGPVLLQGGQINISNEDELKFTGKAINDKHPRTAMGYTADNKLIILAVQGRSEKAGGATLTQEAQILKDLGCIEALNLDGGGSSCLLVNGKETIQPSDKRQRAVPAVFIIKSK